MVALQGVSIQREQVAIDEFEAFLSRTEARLRVALVAAYGPVDGRIAAVDALSWAWEHWDQVEQMANPGGYLYRVGQTSARRNRVRPIPFDAAQLGADVLPEVNTGLLVVVGQLTEQQRTAVMLTHAFGWTVREVARTMDLAPSTVQTHVERGLDRLRHLLEDHR